MLQEVHFFWKSWVVFVLGLIFVFLAFLIFQSMFIDPQYLKPYISENNCNVATIPIAGTMGVGASQSGVQGEELYTASTNGDLDTIIWKLDQAKEDKNIKGVLLQVDSYGGYGSVGELLSNYLSTYPKTVVAYAREAAASNAYWSILPSSYIVANRTSSVGSIGVTMSYVSQAKKNKEEGLDYISLSSGKFKDAGSPDKELTQEEYEYYLQEIKKFAQVFKDDVVKYRNLATSSVDAIADGKSFMGTDALELRLIDEVGDESSVLRWFNEKVFVGDNSDQEAVLCKPTY